MSLKSFLSKLKNRKNTQEERLQEPTVEEKVINLSAFKTSESTMIKDIPYGEYMIIDGFNRYDVKNNKTYTYFYIFKNNDEFSYKVDKIVCFGALVTVKTTYVDKNEEVYHKIIKYDTTDRGLTLREFRDKYFTVNGTYAPEHSLKNMKFRKAYRMTDDNLLYNHFKETIKMVNGRILNHEYYRDNLIDHTETNVTVDVLRNALKSEK